MAEYRAMKAPYERAIAKAHTLIHAYGAQLASYGPVCMQTEYRLTLKVFEGDSLGLSIVARTLNDQWDRLAGWHAQDMNGRSNIALY